MKNILVIVIVMLNVISATRIVCAESTDSTGTVFMGIELRDHDTDMKTEFIRRTSGVVTEQSNFDNNYTSGAGGVFAGYKHPYRRAYLSGRVFFNIFNDDFKTSAGSSRFTNKMNHVIGMDLMPGIYIFRGLSVFTKFGVGMGNFDFVKSSPTSTTYDVDNRLAGYTLGLGFAYDLTSRFTAKIGFDYTEYEKTVIKASKGSRSDKTVVEPETESFYLSLQWNF